MILFTYYQPVLTPKTIWESLRSRVVNVLDCNIVVHEFEIQLRYYIHFWTNTHGKGIGPLVVSQVLFFFKDIYIYIYIYIMDEI